MAPSTTAPTSTTTRTTTTTTTTTSMASPTTTDSAGQNKPKTDVIVIVAIVAGLILFLVAFGTWLYLRKQKIRRMQDAIMPWSSQSNNQFAKVSSMDEGSRTTSPNSRNARVATAAAGGAAGGAAVYASNKAQPKVPQPTAAYYPDEGYGYGQQGAGGGYGANHQQGYNNEDEYYNPYYAQGGPSPAATNATYYSDNRTPYQTPRDPFQGQQQPGYFPPPPPVSTGAQGMPMMTSGSSMTSLPNTNTSSTLTSSSARRGPQVILPEMGHRGDDDATQDIPMKDMTLSS
ncbi:hypothetical protein BGZ58_001493 [Dissophora ornata]|nr:hypothetical protein BGZ58_001493 [Dissophora ornata]